MMPTDPLTTTVLDLDAALGPEADLLIGGGFGLLLNSSTSCSSTSVVRGGSGSGSTRSVRMTRMPHGSQRSSAGCSEVYGVRHDARLPE